MEMSQILPYIFACIVVAIVPGPTVTVIIANSLQNGRKAGFQNIIGTQIGLISMIAILGAGMGTVVAFFGQFFDIIRILGAAYLIWLGVKLWRANGSSIESSEVAPQKRTSFVFQGFLVIWSNPKALLFFGAFIPQFIDPQANVVFQTLILGALFMVVTSVLDSGYAFAAGAIGAKISKNKVRWSERLAGSLMIGGGCWLLAMRR